MKINFSIKYDVLVVKFSESRLDAALVPDMKQQLLEKVNHHDQVVCDLSRVEFMDSSALGALVSAFKNVRERGTMRFCCLQAPVEHLFRLTHVDRIFQVHETVAKAIEDIRYSGSEKSRLSL